MPANKRYIVLEVNLDKDAIEQPLNRNEYAQYRLVQVIEKPQKQGAGVLLILELKTSA